MTTIYENDVPPNAGKLPTLHPQKEFLAECEGQPPMRGRAVDAAGAEAAYRSCLGDIGAVTVREILKNPPEQGEKSVAQLLEDADAALATVAQIGETQLT